VTVGLSVNAPRKVRMSLDRYEGGIEASLLDDLRLVSSELVANAVRHSGCPEGDPIEFQFSILPGKVRIQVIDGGEGAENLEARASNSGLRLVEALSDRWASSAENSFNVWLEIDTDPVLIQRKQRA
jgi:hypothetical protein